MLSNSRNSVYVILNVALIITSMSTLSFLITAQYFVELMFFIFGLFCVKQRPPKHFWPLVVTFVVIATINTFISKYNPGVVGWIVGLLITCFPFINYGLSYNFLFTPNDLYKYIDILITTVLAIALYAMFVVGLSNLLALNYHNGIIVRYGFFASLCNQTLIIALLGYRKTQKKKYKVAVVVLMVSIVLTIQIKATILMFIIVAAYNFFFSTKNKVNGVFKIAVAMASMLIVISSIPALNNKVSRYLEIYDITNAENVETTARLACYVTSFKLANDHFPLGSGQGTFGSVPANMNYSEVYSDYNIDKVWGLQFGSDHNFILDTHWSYILGENGWLGLLLYLSIITYSVRRYLKLPKEKRDASLTFVVIMSPLCVILESFALPLINRLAFITFYSGLSSIILRMEEKRIGVYNR